MNIKNSYTVKGLKVIGVDTETGKQVKEDFKVVFAGGFLYGILKEENSEDKILELRIVE
jgi:hypothetical protein